MTVTLHKAKPLRGEILIPSDKSITHRALLLGALADGTSVIRQWLDAGDPRSTLRCLRALGVDVHSEKNALIIRGKPDRAFKQPDSPLDAGNSGTTIRLLSGILAGQRFRSIIGGDQYLNNRPMKRIIDPLTLMGAKIEASARSTAPLTVHGKNPLGAITYTLPVASAQVKSAVLLAGLLADGTTTVVEPQVTRDHTERMLGLVAKKVGTARHITIDPRMSIPAREYTIPSDVSSAMFIVAAALLIPGSEIVLPNVGLNPTRTAALEVLIQRGARITISDEHESGGEPLGTLHVSHSELTGECNLSPDLVPILIDEIPILAVTAMSAGIPFSVKGASELRAKESDRIRTMVMNLRSMNVETEEYVDGFAFQGKNIVFGSSIDTGGDHRIAMAFGVAGCAGEGSTVIRGAESAQISFPGFWDVLSQYQ